MARRLEDRLRDLAWDIKHGQSVPLGRSTVSARILALLEDEKVGCVGYTGCAAETHLSDCPRW